MSVIVPVRNGRQHLERLVEALKAQSLPHDEFELVVADDGSTDGSQELLRRAGGEWITIAEGPPRNSYAARNRAVAAARGEILAFCDADCVPVGNWLQTGLAALETADIVAGRIRFILPAKRTVWTLLDMDSSKDHEREVRNATAETANLLMRRKLYDDVGGFEDRIPEFGDFDFVQRAVAVGARLVYARDVVVWHPTRDSAKSFLRAQWIYSRGYAVREGRAGRRPQELRLKALIPAVGTYYSRRWWGRSVGPDRRWLQENGVIPTRFENACALPIMYLLVPYLRIAAQLLGWLEGRRRYGKFGDGVPPCTAESGGPPAVQSDPR